MNTSAGKSVDFVTTKKKEGGLAVAQALLYVLYAAVAVGIFYLLMSVLGLGAIGALIAGVLGPTFIYILYLATRHICNYDLMYTIATPTAKTMDAIPHVMISFEIVKDKKKRDPDKRDVKFEDEVRNAELFAPYTEEYKNKYASADVKKTVDFRSSIKATDVYFGLFPSKDGGKTVVIFEAVNKVVESLEYYNKEATVVTKLSR